MTAPRFTLPGGLLAFALVALCAAFTAFVGRIDSAIAPGAPPHSDLGGHIVALRHLVEISLPHGHLTDWSHQWFAGYPSFYFYFPLPALVIAALAQFMPLEIAVKLVAVLAPAALPPATYLLVRAFGYGRLHAACACIAMVAYLTMTHQYIFGGNVLSSVIGEYSFAVGLLLAVAYLAVIARVMQGRPHTAALSLILAACALTHTITTLFAVIGACAALGQRDARRQILTSWVIAFALSAFWTVPFLLRAPFMGRIEWTYVMKPWLLFPLPVIMVLPIVAGAFFSLRPYRRELLVLAAFSVSGAVAYLVPHTFFAPARAWPIWHYGVFVWCGLGISAGLQRAWEQQRKLPLTAWSAALVLLIGLSIIQMDLVRKRAGELLATTAPDSEQFDSLRATLATLPPGLLHWEQLQSDEEVLGGHLALASVPSKLPHMRTAVGLLRESGLMSPVTSYLRSNISWDTIGTGGLWQLITPNDFDEQRMRHRLRAFGINYFVSVSDRGRAWAAADPALFVHLADGPGWSLFRTHASPLVQPLRRTPLVVRDTDWDAEVIEWIRTVDDTTTWKLYQPPADIALPNSPATMAATVTRAELGYNAVRFSTAAVGVPHLVRVAYFPNWKVNGGSGPYLTVPGFMTVVPTQTEVELTFERTMVDHAGRVMTVLALAALLFIWWRERIGRRTYGMDGAKIE